MPQSGNLTWGLGLTFTFQLAEETTEIRWPNQWTEATLLQALATKTSEINLGLLELLLEHG